MEDAVLIYKRKRIIVRQMWVGYLAVYSTGRICCPRVARMTNKYFSDKA